MASTSRKRKHPGREAPPLCGGARARGSQARPVRPQPIGCRVEGCREPLTPGYHKKYRICLHHGSLERLLIDGKTCRWCQQCGRFHGLDAFDAKYRSCRHSLVRHQQRRQRRQAQLAALCREGEQAQALPGQPSQQDGQPSQPLLQPQPQPLPQPQSPRLQPQPQAQPDEWPVQATAPTPPRRPVRQQQVRRAGGRQLGDDAQWATPAAETASASGSGAQLPTDRPSLTQRLVSLLQCGQHSMPPPSPTAPPAGSVQQVQPWDPLQPVTPPGQPGSLTASSLPAGESHIMCAPSHTAPLCSATMPHQYQQQQRQPQPQPQPQQHLPPPPPLPLPQRQQQQQAPWSPVQPPPALPAGTAWAQQAPDGGWLLFVGDHHLAAGQPSLQSQPSLIPAAVSRQQQPGGQACGPPQRVQQMLDASGMHSSSATCHPCYEPAVLHELLQPRSPAMQQQQPPSSLTMEAATCSASTPPAPFSPHASGPRYSLVQCGSGSGSAHTAAATLGPAYGGSARSGQCPPYYSAGPAGRPEGLFPWANASLPAAMPPEGYSGSSNALNQAWGQLAWQDEERQAAVQVTSPRGPVPPSQPACLQLSPCTSLQPSQLPGQLSYQPASLQFSPHSTVPPSAPPSQPLSLQPSAPPSLQPSAPPSLQPSLMHTLHFSQPPSPLLSPCSAAQPSKPPSQPACRQPSLPPLPPRASPAYQQAPTWRQPQCREMDWADDALIPSTLCCPPSPSVSWL